MFATPGTYSYVVPDGVSDVVVEVQGAGGGGGGHQEGGGTGGPDGAGGGQGGYLEALLPVTGGQTLAVTVGGGGSGGLSENTNCTSGARGANSSVGYTDETQLIQADGGGGGGCPSTGEGGGTAGFGALASPATGIAEPTVAAGNPPAPNTLSAPQGGAGGGLADFAGSGGAGGGLADFAGSGGAGYVVILP